MIIKYNSKTVFCGIIILTLNGIEVSRTPKGFPEQLAIVLTYQCRLFLFFVVFLK